MYASNLRVHCSWLAVQDFAEYLESNTTLLHLRLPKAAVQPDSADVMSRHLTQTVISPAFLGEYKRVMEDPGLRSEVFKSCAPEGTFRFLRTLQVIDAGLSGNATYLGHSTDSHHFQAVERVRQTQRFRDVQPYLF